MKRPHRLVAALVAASVLPACTVHYSLVEFDAAARRGAARTIVLEDGLSLYSPYGAERTRLFLLVVKEQRDEVFALFGVTRERPLLVELRLNESLGRRPDGTLSLVPDERVSGRATIDHVSVEVDPQHVLELGEGRELTGGADPSMYAGTLRHELAHVALGMLGLELDGWRAEGLAHAVELVPIEPGRLDLGPVRGLLVEIAALPREQRDVQALLAWRQGSRTTDADVSMRRLALALVLFLLERDGAPDLRTGVQQLMERDGRDLVALEEEWSRWLDGFGHSSAP